MGDRRVVANLWDKARCGETPSPAMVANLSPEQSEELTIYPPRSLGEAFCRYRRTDEWSRKPVEDLVALLKRIRPVFGDCDPRTATLETISEWRKKIEETRLAARGSSLPEDLANTVEGVGRARLLRSRCRSGARRAQQCRKGPVAVPANGLLLSRGGDHGLPGH